MKYQPSPDSQVLWHAGRFGRREMLTAMAALIPLAGCAHRSQVSRPPAATTASPNSPLSQSFAALERKYDARLGVYALSTTTATTIAYRADERFAFCSTFKAPLAAAVLQGHPVAYLDTVISYRQDAIHAASPITEQHVETGMTIGQLCDAATRYSDNTAANLLLNDIGGPAGFTTYLRSLGDTVSRLDQAEPEMNRNPPGDERDTTTPRAVGGVLQKLILGDALTSDKRAMLTDWMVRNTTGNKRIRAGFPADWKIADRTGSGDYGRANAIAVVWSPAGAPSVVAIMSDRNGGYEAQPSDALIADAAAGVASVLV
ncbi:class A beta-lactamase [Mycobacterium haemophilum]